MLYPYVERGGDQVAFRSRLEEESIPTRSRKQYAEPDSSVRRIGFLRVDVEINEVAVSERNEVAEGTEVGFESRSFTAITYLEFQRRSS